MNRVQVLHALAECVGNRLVVQDIESVSGRLTSEQLAELESLVVKDVIVLRAAEMWPPELRDRSDDD